MLAAVVLYGETFNYVCIGGVRGLFGKQYTFGSLIMLARPKVILAWAYKYKVYIILYRHTHT